MFLIIIPNNKIIFNKTVRLNNKYNVILQTKHAESLNVDSILCLPELYSKPTTPQELIEYLEKVGKAAPKTPLLYYHIPMLTNVNSKQFFFNICMVNLESIDVLNNVSSNMCIILYINFL